MLLAVGPDCYANPAYLDLFRGSVMSVVVEKPWWMWIGGDDMCVTLFGHIWVPKKLWPLSPWLLAHEEVHLRQQASTSTLAWALRWKLDRTFRLNCEAEAYAAQVKIYPLDYQYAISELCSRDYDWAATSPDLAKAVLDSYLAKLD